MDINESRTFTWFGVDILLTADSWLDPYPAWDRVYGLDSDGDGQTNGQELGDPCGVWSSGESPSYEDASHPGDAESLVEAPPQDQCSADDTGDTADTDVPGVEPTESCLYSTVGSRGSAAAWLAGMFWLCARRRRGAGEVA